jgi:formylglycine-generating enzyme required for sulfatase activity
MMEMHTLDEELQGKVIDRKYRLVAELGRGAMGVVYRAEQLDVEGRPQRQIALKTMRLEASCDPEFSRRFLREIRVAMQLHGRYTVTVYDSGKDENGQLYYTMELVEGQTLQDLLRQHRILSTERGVRLACQICEGLAEAPRLPEPVVHRDLKPANIFIEQSSGQEWIKIGDFGIAKVLSEQTAGLTQPGQIQGTPRYMAPEQWLGKAIDHRTDLYALGIILYEMVAGKVPFTAEQGLQSLIYQHVQQPPPALPGSVPVGIRTLVQRLLAKTPQDRPADALRVRRALETVLTEEDGGDTIVIGEDPSPPPLVTMPQPLPSRPRIHPQEGQESDIERKSTARISHLLQRKGLIATVTVSLFSVLALSFPESLRTGVKRWWHPVPAVQQEATLVAPTTNVRANLDTGEMILIPAGEFWMGCNEAIDLSCYADEKPGRRVFVEAFAIDRHEVTVAAYEQCVQAGRCSRDSFTTSISCNWGKEGRERHPINCVNWEQAKTYCEWVGKRLPTEAEWEKAARGTDGRIYPWGNEWDTRKANTDRSEDGFSETSPVDSFPAGASPYGVLDMSGNVFEWMADWYDGEQINRSLRGGSWNYTIRDVRTSNRYGEVPHSHRGDVGFRCAW